MSIGVEVEKQDAYQSMKAVGENDSLALRDLADRVETESWSLGYHNILLDLTCVTGKAIPRFECFQLGTFCAEVWKGSLRIAIVSQNGIDRFFEDVAQNQGAQVCVFGEKGRAIQWLEAHLAQGGWGGHDPGKTYCF